MDQTYLLNMVAAGLSKTDWVSGTNNTPEKSGDVTSDFQKMLDQKSQSAKPDSQSKDQTKTENKPASAAKKEETPAPKEDPVETVKRMQVYLTPVSPQELAQYPAEWLPQVQEGEAIVCVGVQTDENGQQIPILMGANEAFDEHGWKVAGPELLEQPQGEIEIPEELAQAPEQTEIKEFTPQENAPVMEQVEEAEPQAQSQEGEDFEIVDHESAPKPVFHDVEAAPIKVSETATAEESGKTQDVSTQLANGVNGALQQGESRVTVSLTPESLGTVRVEITRSQDGALHVALSAENNQTRSLLEKHVVNLQTMLGSQRQETVQVEVQRQENQQNNPYDGRNGHNGQPQQEQQRRHKSQDQNGQDFLQQLRLGLISVETEN